MPLLGCTNCGLVLEAEATTGGVGHLTMEPCPECDRRLRAVGLVEAEQLTRERFLAARWRELAAKKAAASGS